MTILARLKARLDIALGHTQEACTGVRRVPAARRHLINQLAVPCRKGIALRRKADVYQAVVFFGQREADRIGMALCRKPRAALGVPEIAAGLQLLLAGTDFGAGSSRTGAAPSRAQRQALRKGPIALKALFGQEEGARHKLSRCRGYLTLY